MPPKAPLVSQGILVFATIYYSCSTKIGTGEQVASDPKALKLTGWLNGGGTHTRREERTASSGRPIPRRSPGPDRRDRFAQVRRRRGLSVLSGTGVRRSRIIASISGRNETKPADNALHVWRQL